LLHLDEQGRCNTDSGRRLNKGIKGMERKKVREKGRKEGRKENGILFGPVILHTCTVHTCTYSTV
jgi:hypothetical protein